MVYRLVDAIAARDARSLSLFVGAALTITALFGWYVMVK
jgi:hypothetical protein